MNGEVAPGGPEGIQFSDDMRDAYGAIGVLVFQALAFLLSMFATNVIPALYRLTLSF